MNNFIKFSYFINLNSPSNGGAISLNTTDETEILSCVFERCQTSSEGGGIFIEGFNNKKLSKLCFYYCIAYESVAIRINTIQSDDSEANSHLHQISTLKCSQLSAEENKGATIWDMQSNSYMKNINISHTTVNHIAAYYCQNCSICDHSQVNLINNNSSVHGVLIQFSFKDQISLSFFNVLSNLCPINLIKIPSLSQQCTSLLFLLLREHSIFLMI